MSVPDPSTTDWVPLAVGPGLPVGGSLGQVLKKASAADYDATWQAEEVSTPPDATTSSKGIIQLAGDLAGTAASPQIAAGVITDAEVASANKDGVAGTASLRTLGTGAQQAVAGNDSRLSNSRTPTAHASTHQPGGSDPMAVDAAAATASLRTLGTGAAQAAAGNDARFTDARAPTAHASTHQPGGSDAMAVDAAVGTGSLRTLGTGATQAAPGNDPRFLPTDVVVAAATRIIANKLLAGDAQPVFRMLGDGKLEWGPGGSTAPDTSLYRKAADVLGSDDTFWADGGLANLTKAGAPTDADFLSSQLKNGLMVVDTSNNRLYVRTGTATWKYTAVDGAAAPSGPPAGSGSIWFGATAPSGWAICDGSTITNGQTLYPDLWAVLAPAWKSGSNIVLPDLRGRFPLGLNTPAAHPAVDALGDSDARALADRHSYINVTLANHVHAGPSHTHDMANHQHYMSSNNTWEVAGGGFGSTSGVASSWSGTPNINTTGAGGNGNTGGPSTNTSDWAQLPMLVVNYIIKLT